MNICEKIARQAHDGQFRRDGVTPYITHVEKVAGIVSKHHGHNDVVCLAWLHDVLEDCEGWTVERLIKEGVPRRIAECADTMDKNQYGSYEEYIQQCKGVGVRDVKVADICANLTDNPTEKQKAKYTKSLMCLCKY